MSVVARNALPYLKWWPHDAVATQILLHCNLKLLFIVYTPLHCGSGRRKWILHKFFTHNFSSLFSVATWSLFRITLCSYFYNVTNLFVFPFAFGIKIQMLTIRSLIRLIMHHIIKSFVEDAFIKWNFLKANGKESKIQRTEIEKVQTKNPQGISEHKMSGFVLHIIKFCVYVEWTLEIRVQISYRIICVFSLIK